MPIDVTELTMELISRKSITGIPDDGAIDVLVNRLKPYNFECKLYSFSGDNSYDVLNLYAQYGNKGKNLCFAGHTDVVPPGDVNLWSVPPFEPRIVDGYLIGRGAVDMKGGICAWVSAVSEFLEENKGFDKGTLSFLITGDEEADAINGTQKILKLLAEEGTKIDACVVGEPSSLEVLGDYVKIGRRGSISFILTVEGIQGHIAYPEKFINPNTLIVNILKKLVDYKLDEGNEKFQASNLEITSIDVSNATANLVPQKAEARFNIRFNDEHTLEELKQLIHSICASVTERFALDIRKGPCESFLGGSGSLVKIIQDSAQQIIGRTPEESTGGGTSDARFIKNYAEVAEFGPVNSTAHKIDEKISVEDLIALKNIYKKIIENYFRG